jgi:adenine-specific DNA-methyltransferase
MAPGAIAGWLIPSEFMDVNYGQKVREYLLSQVTLLHIHRFDPDDVQFTDALVSSAVVWIKNERPKPGHQVRFTYGGTFAKPAVEKAVESVDLSAEYKWTRYPRQSVRDFSRRATVGDLFKIKRGLATGDNGFFILDEATVKERDIPALALRPILPSPRYVDGDVIQSNKQGLPTNVRRLFLLDPRMDMEQIERSHPLLASYLDEGKERGLHDRYLCRTRKRWYDQENREPAPIVCTYLGRGDSKSGRPFRFIRNRSSATVANSYLAMYPTPALETRLAKEPELIDSIWQQLNVILPEALLAEGRVYGGGLYKLEPKELAKVPLDLD